MPFIPSNEVILPIGIDYKGERYRSVVIDEMKGIDNQNLATRENRKNGAKAITTLLRRCILEIPNLVKRKENPRLLIDSEIVKSMYTSDRDFLFMNIVALNKETTFTAKHKCPNCSGLNHTDVDLMDVDVTDLEEDESPVFEGDLLSDFHHDSKVYTGFRWSFPTGSTAERVARSPEGKQPLEIIRYCAVLLTDEREELKPAPDVVEMLPSDTIQDMHTQAKEQTPGPELSRKVTCDNDTCGHEFEGEIDLSNFLQSTKKPQRNKFKRKLRRRKRESHSS